MIRHVRWLKLARLLVCTSVALVFFAPGVSATSEAPSDAVPELEDAVTYERASVTLDGEELFRVRGGTTYPAAERAKAIQERIKSLAGDRSIPADSLRVLASADRSSLVAPGHFVMAVFDEDAQAERFPRHILAERLRNEIVRSVKRFREDRTPHALLANGIRALAVILGALLLLWLTNRLYRRLGRWIRRHLDTRIARLRTMTGRVAQTETLSALVGGFFTAVRVGWILLIAYFSLNIVLGFFPWTRSLSKRVMSIVLDPLQSIGAAFVDSLPGLVFIALLWIVTRYVLKVVRVFFSGVEQERITVRGFDRDWALPTYRIAHVVILVFAAIIAYPYIPGSGTDAFKGVSLFLGIIFSLGSSSFVANVIAGYSLIYRRAFKIGDRVRFGDVEGLVSNSGAMVTHLRTLKNEDIVVPNSLILNNNITNFSTLASTRGLILHTTVGIGYETPWRQVDAMLKLAAARTPGALKEPAPFVWLKSLGDFAVTYELNVYTNDPMNHAHLYSALHRNVLDAFNEYGVQIMTPAYEGDPQVPKVVPKEGWFTPPAGMEPSSDPEGGKARAGS